ncbi:hypothetical protein C1X84_02320 [Pseudomonas sp. GP01-A1]|nr:hypothetical protein C0058_30110 [Pseudomonas sp. NC02]PMU26930.1 hypothetical protein C1X90_04685 [Pseudomonas sp. GP01-A9]PMU31965.1 hypothetical protein C1X88_03255 [Pseudomonas sp. GP01-A13]PMU51901.1 hypothetical protein C1X87_11825 [Pseudomonas sp. GP01-A14]PMU64297.1 hypothetical protein C1X86_03020 [Pseudomonas sp. GP01-A3]PMU80302.1 hypothetical protein C1X81_00685 [Pseudomonas sp. FW215-L2]PMU80822.1 hypothetical protein C1X84_02320 [Pseudomonas sp. GP01-A1]PMU84312.1 hypothetic
MIVPTLCVGTPPVTLCVTRWDAERPGLHSHAERGNDLYRAYSAKVIPCFSLVVFTASSTASRQSSR